MEKSAIKELMYGGINELMQNNRYYYRSSVGRGYSKWTEHGEQALKEFVSEISHLINEAEEQALDQRAKQLVIEELKG
jgi:hypothetical protein